MTNIQVTHDTNYQHARSESYIAVNPNKPKLNPNNPHEMVAVSKKFRDIYNYDFTVATSCSSDGGYTWYPSQDLKIPDWNGISDPALAWDDVGDVYLVGVAWKNPPKIDTVGIAVYKSTDGGATWGDPKLIHAAPGDDKSWAAADSNLKSNYRGRVYAIWSSGNGGGLHFARTIDHGKSWIGIGTDPAGSRILQTPFFLISEINVAANGDIYIIWVVGEAIGMIVSTDGGDSFHESKVSPALGITPLDSPPLLNIHNWHAFPGGTFRVATYPTACTGPLPGQVMVAWADYREGISRIYYAYSEDGGDSWSTGKKGQPLLKGTLPNTQQHFHPQIVTKPDGAVGCAFYEFGPKPTDYLIDVILAESSDGKTFSQRRVTDKPWNPAVDAPWAHNSEDEPPYIGPDSATFIGEYFGLDASDKGFYPLWTDTRTGIQELWVDIPWEDTMGEPSPPLPKPPMSFEDWIIRLLDDSGGWIIPIGPGGKPSGPPQPSPPPFDLMQDILLGLANYRIATLITGEEGRALQKAALNMLASVAGQQLQRLESNDIAPTRLQGPESYRADAKKQVVTTERPSKKPAGRSKPSRGRSTS
jgi:hypothetical protein